MDVEDGANEGTEEEDCEDGCQTPCPLVVGVVAWGANRLHEVVYHRLVADWGADDVGEVDWRNRRCCKRYPFRSDKATGDIYLIDNGTESIQIGLYRHSVGRRVRIQNRTCVSQWTLLHPSSS